MNEFMDGFMKGYFGGLGYGSAKGLEMINKAKFEKKAHALYYVLRQEGFKPSNLAVYPLPFIMHDSRIIFEDSPDVLKAHKDRLRSLGLWIWISWTLSFAPVLVALVWSVLIMAQSSVAYYVLILSSSAGVLALAIPLYRSLMVVIKKRGWPKECFLYDSPGGQVF